MSRIIKNRSNVSNLKFIPTWKLKEIIDSANHVGIDGADYGPVIHELEAIYYERVEKLQTDTLSKLMTEMMMQTEAGNLPPAMPDECYLELA